MLVHFFLMSNTDNQNHQLMIFNFANDYFTKSKSPLIINIKNENDSIFQDI